MPLFIWLHNLQKLLVRSSTISTGPCRNGVSLLMIIAKVTVPPPRLTAERDEAVTWLFRRSCSAALLNASILLLSWYTCVPLDSVAED